MSLLADCHLALGGTWTGYLWFCTASCSSKRGSEALRHNQQVCTPDPKVRQVGLGAGFWKFQFGSQVFSLSQVLLTRRVEIYLPQTLADASCKPSPAQKKKGAKKDELQHLGASYQLLLLKGRNVSGSPQCARRVYCAGRNVEWPGAPREQTRQLLRSSFLKPRLG